MRRGESRPLNKCLPPVHGFAAGDHLQRRDALAVDALFDGFLRG